MVVWVTSLDGYADKHYTFLGAGPGGGTLKGEMPHGSCGWTGGRKEGGQVEAWG